MTEATRYLKSDQWYSLYIEWTAGQRQEYARRFESFDEATAFGIEMQVLTGRLLKCEVVPVDILSLKTWEDVDHEVASSPAITVPKFDHFEELKDFAETHPGVPVIFNGPGILNEDGQINEVISKIAESAGGLTTEEQGVMKEYFEKWTPPKAPEIDDEIPF